MGMREETPRRMRIGVSSGRDEKTTRALCAEAHGFSLHAGVRSGADQRKALERLCRYITRPAIANERLKRVFDIDLEHCPQCGGEFRIIAAIEEPAVIVRILTHLGLPARAPPRAPAGSLALFQAA